MKYQAPFGSSDPNAPYVDRNTPGAVRGSVPSAAAIEDPQRELVSFIEKCGGVPDADDLMQVLKAARSQRTNWVPVVGGSANALTVAFDPPFTSLADLIGVPLRVKFALTNTSASVTLAVNGLPPVGVNRPDRSLRIGDLRANFIGELIYDGTYFRAKSLPLFGVSSGAGWIQFSDGLIFQYGSLNTLSSAPLTVTLPRNFETTDYSAVVTDKSSPVEPSQMTMFGTGNYTTTSFQAFATRNFTAYQADAASWHAIGV